MLQQQDSTPRFGAYSRAYPKAQWTKPRRPPVVCLLMVAVLMLVAAAAGHWLLSTEVQPAVRYAAVVDSGSSGTRIYVYNWTLPSTQGHHSSSSSSSSRAHSASSGGISSSHLPIVQPIPPSAAAHLVPKHARKGLYNRVETRPGLDAFAGQPSRLSTALEPLLVWARAVVPAGQQHSSPIFLMATGGLRRLPDEQQQELLAQARVLLGKSGFRFEPSWARVISGDDEGAYGWLALNYQQGRLRPYSKAAAGAAGAAAADLATPVTSLGALDLGGSSLQVTFEVQPATSSSSHTSSSHTSSSRSSHTSSSGSSHTSRGSSHISSSTGAAMLPAYNISVAGNTFWLHLHSFKQYGLNEAYDRSISVLLAQQQQQQQRGVQASPQHTDDASDALLRNGTAASSSTSATTSAVLETPSSSSDTTAASQQHTLEERSVVAAAQHDLAVAHAAGVDAADDHTANGATGPVAASAIQQEQADLAAAAAAGFHPHAPPAAGSSVGTPSADPVESTLGTVGSSSSSSSSSSSNAVLHSSSSSSSSHLGPQPAPHRGSSSLLVHQPAAASAALLQPSRSGGRVGLGLSLHTSAAASIPPPPPPPQQPSASQAAAGVTLVSPARPQGRRRLSLLQQQRQWLEQLLGPAPQLIQELAARAQHETLQRSSTALMLGSTHQQHHDPQHPLMHAQLRQLLFRDVPAATALVGHDSSIYSSSSSSSAVVAEVGADKAAVAPHPVVPAGTGYGSGSSSSSVGVAKSATAIQQHQQLGPASESKASTLAMTSPDSNSNPSNNSTLPVVLHPCLHDGFKAVYDRVAYDGITPTPPQVLLRGHPHWQSCLQLVDAVVNASAPCAVQAHAPTCVLGTPQPELTGDFMALSGFYVVARFLGVQSSSRSSLGALLDAAQALCARPWPWVQAKLGSNVNVERYCTWGPYVVALLLRGLGLDERQVVVAADGDLGWPLGAVLAEGSRLRGFSAGTQAAAAAAAQRVRAPGRRGGAAAKHTRSSMRGTGSWQQQQRQQQQQNAAAAAESPAAALPPAPGPSSTLQQQQQHVEHEVQPLAHGPSWSLGLLHHSQRGAGGLVLSGPGWLAVVLLVWLLVMGWCRGVCGPLGGRPGGPGTGVVGHGRAAGGAGHAVVRGKLTPNRSSFKLATQ